MNDRSAPRLAATTDKFLGGKVHIVQPAKGHRAGLDAALLQAAIPSDAKGKLVELGCGAGQVIFAICARAPNIHAVGVDADHEILTFAQHGLNLPENSMFADRIRLIECDVSGRRNQRETAGLLDDMADWLVMNPPFYVEGQGRAPKEPGRRSAHVADASTLGAWIATASGVLRPHGHLALIERADRLPDILFELKGRFGRIQVVPIQSHINEPANRVLVSARSADKRPLSLLPPLVLHEETGGWTKMADALLRGKTTLNLSLGDTSVDGKSGIKTGRQTKALPCEAIKVRTNQ